MILSFSTKFPNGKPTYFIDKIWCFIAMQIPEIAAFTLADYSYKYVGKFGQQWDKMKYHKLQPKLHTIRKDEHNRWKAGMNIHMVVFPRSKKMFQFAPILECKSVQRICINHTYSVYFPEINESLTAIWIDRRQLSKISEYEALAKNDGFDSVDDFFDWFNADFTGKIIH
jgi:hypothetical protein